MTLPMITLEWRPLAYPAGRDLVKGTELASAFVPDTLHRFAVVETRAIDAEGLPCLIYRLRDAETITDSEVREGVKPRVIGTYPEPEDAVSHAYGLMLKSFGILENL